MITLGLLDAVGRDASVTQRAVARELGIALGLTNAYLKRCVRKGLIKIGQIPTRRYAYFLTPKGMAEKSRLTASYLARSFSFFRQARIECGNIYIAAGRRGQVRIGLVGQGDLAEIAILVAREYPVEIVGIIPANCEPEKLATIVAALGRVDALVITSMENTREVCAALIATFGDERVYVPALLRVRLSSAVALSGASNP